MTAALPGIPLEAWRRRGRTLDFKGFPIRYWEAGQGRPLLLIHGFPSAAWDWHYQPVEIRRDDYAHCFWQQRSRSFTSRLGRQSMEIARFGVLQA
ncbi:alpha/beta fold hydrolase, partial [Pseudomonas aeruginosa]|nr:hypothetical protein [Pseudomonas aeruginosa]MCC0511314.1 hypothetical protein [Pseudomonas aeruginosa]